MAAPDQAGDTPRLGTVVRFTPQAAGAGIRKLESGGFRVASSRDFRSAAAVPNPRMPSNACACSISIEVPTRDAESKTTIVVT